MQIVYQVELIELNFKSISLFIKQKFSLKKIKKKLNMKINKKIESVDRSQNV